MHGLSCQVFLARVTAAAFHAAAARLKVARRLPPLRAALPRHDPELASGGRAGGGRACADAPLAVGGGGSRDDEDEGEDEDEDEDDRRASGRWPQHWSRTSASQPSGQPVRPSAVQQDVHGAGHLLSTPSTVMFASLGGTITLPRCFMDSCLKLRNTAKSRGAEEKAAFENTTYEKTVCKCFCSHLAYNHRLGCLLSYLLTACRKEPVFISPLAVRKPKRVFPLPLTGL